MRARWLIAFIVLAIESQPTVVWSQSALPPAVDAFVSAASALGKSANERVDLGRASMRLDQIKQAATEQVLQAKEDKKANLQFDTQSLLCSVRSANLEIAARRNYIQAVAGRVEEIGKPSKIDNLESAFKSLFSGQSLDITAGIPTSQELENNRKQIIERCQRDIKGFTAAYYGKDIVSQELIATKDTPGAALPLFAAVGALVDTIVSIITPAVVEGAKLIDEERRRAAVLRYLTEPSNIKKINDSGLALAREVSAFTWNKRLRLAGAYNEQAAQLRALKN